MNERDMRPERRSGYDRRASVDIRLACFSCGKSVSTPVPGSTVVRASLECPECLEKKAASGEREGVLNGPATQATVTTESPGVVDPPERVSEARALRETLLEAETSLRAVAMHSVQHEMAEDAKRVLVKIRQVLAERPEGEA